MFRKISVFVLLCVFIAVGSAYGRNLVIFHAGSLSIPLKKASAMFEKANPDVRVLLEASGSRVAARKVSELHRKADIVASADYTVINTLLMPKFANWNVIFARNELVMAYTEKSKYASEINGGNWYRLIVKKSVKLGYSDPNADPCGYRAVMMFQLAENFYKQKGFKAEVLKKSIIRPKSVELIALLQTENLDYAVEYRSVAVQHRLKFIKLPAQINLSSLKYAKFYSRAEVKVSGKKPGTYVVKKGKPIVYGLTMPLNAPDKKMAIKFLQFFLSKNGGLKILEECGQPPIVPPVAVKGRENLPEVLKNIVK